MTYYIRNEWNPKSQIYTHSNLHFTYMEYNSCFLFTENMTPKKWFCSWSMTDPYAELQGTSLNRFVGLVFLLGCNENEDLAFTFNKFWSKVKIFNDLLLCNRMTDWFSYSTVTYQGKKSFFVHFLTLITHARFWASTAVQLRTLFSGMLINVGW
jgi:hypothetical protein